MKISELVTLLRIQLAQLGDIEVEIPIDSDFFGYEPIGQVQARHEEAHFTKTVTLRLIAEGN